MCASHSSEERHIDRTLGMLAKVGRDEADLRCGGHPSLSDSVDRAWIRSGFVPTAACSNCSGKHVAMLAGAQAICGDAAEYHLPDHPMQRLVRRVVAELCDLPQDAVGWGIDGCNLPTPAFPLDRLSRLYARLADAADVTSPEPARTARLGRIFHAMTRHPELVAGEGRFCTTLMRAFTGTLVGKLGADGCYGIGIRAGEDTKRLGTEGAIGIAVKVEDGNIEVLYAVVSEILEQLEVGTPEMRRSCMGFHRPQRRNTVGIETGGISFPFSMRPAEHLAG